MSWIRLIFIDSHDAPIDTDSNQVCAFTHRREIEFDSNRSLFGRSDDRINKNALGTHVANDTFGGVAESIFALLGENCG